MNRQKPIILIIPTIIVMLSACVQGTYFAASPNVNCFENEKEKNIKISTGLSHWELQSNIALNNKYGLSLCGYGGFNNQFGGEIAGIYFKRYTSNKYFEVQVGYGYYNINSWSATPLSPGALIQWGHWYNQDIKTNYHKIFIQPTLFIYSTDNLNIGFALKLNSVFYNTYYLYFNEHDNTDGSSDTRIRESETYFKNKWCFIIEPVFRLQYKHFFYQITKILSTNCYNSTVTSGVYNIEKNYLYHDTFKKLSDERNPKHLNIIQSFGLEFKFGNKK